MYSDRDLLRWSEALAGIARTGLGFTQSLYERERFEEILAVASEIRAMVGTPGTPDTIVDEWMKHVGEGIAGYQTPKATVGAIVHNEAGELLESGCGGLADDPDASVMWQDFASTRLKEWLVENTLASLEELNTIQDEAKELVKAGIHDKTPVPSVAKTSFALPVLSGRVKE